MNERAWTLDHFFNSVLTAANDYISLPFVSAAPFFPPPRLFPRLFLICGRDTWDISHLVKDPLVLSLSKKVSVFPVMYYLRDHVSTFVRTPRAAVCNTERSFSLYSQGSRMLWRRQIAQLGRRLDIGKVGETENENSWDKRKGNL